TQTHTHTRACTLYIWWIDIYSPIPLYVCTGNGDKVASGPKTPTLPQYHAVLRCHLGGDKWWQMATFDTFRSQTYLILPVSGRLQTGRARVCVRARARLRAS